MPSSRRPGGAAGSLPGGWALRGPGEADLRELVGLLGRRRAATSGPSSVDPDQVRAELAGTGSWTRRHLVAADPDGALRAWAQVHDRAAGRTGVSLTVDPGCPAGQADAVAGVLLAWARETALAVAAARGLDATQMDASLGEGEDDLARWYTAVGLRHTRTWLHMSRPVAPDGPPPQVRPGVRVRPVDRHPSGMPLAQDLQAVHQVLEESFVDHFNSYRESFPEFVQRLREDPGHRWDHWWLAEADTPDGPVLAGAVVGSVLREDAEGHEGSYIDYIGVHRRARGLGVAKALLATVVDDARRRGRNRVGLEVDADSPTGAVGLYESLGWVTRYRTQSWQRQLETPTPTPR